MKRAILIGVFFVLFSHISFAQDRDNVAVRKDTICDCKPSLPIEIAATSLIWGLPTYVLWRGAYDFDSNGYALKNILLLPTWFLLMPVLGYSAELTSGCEASHWHALWIGIVTGAVSFVIYGGFYGFEHREVKSTFHKFNFIDYLALGVLPSVASVLIFNLFLEPPEEGGNQGMLIFPSIGLDNSASLNLMMKF